MSERQKQLLEAYFSCIGSQAFATEMSKKETLSIDEFRAVGMSLSDAETIAATEHHGNIGAEPKTLSLQAAREQALVLKEAQEVRAELRALGEEYKEKYGIKFMVFAPGKSAQQMKEILLNRLDDSKTTWEDEWDTAREVIVEIGLKRARESPVLLPLIVASPVKALRSARGVQGVQLAVSACHDADPSSDGSSITCFADSEDDTLKPQSYMSMASLSKSVGSAFAFEFLRKRGIPISASVNSVLAGYTNSPFRILPSEGCPAEWADKVTIQHLMRHNAMGMHYVYGVPCDRDFPPILDFLNGIEAYGYPPQRVINEPGKTFKYSGGGFMVLEHLIEAIDGSGKTVTELTRPFLDELGMQEFTFDQHPPGVHVSPGFRDDGEMVEAGRKMFPRFAAGSWATCKAMLRFCHCMAEAYTNMDGCGPISHETARMMLFDLDSRSNKVRNFMGCKMGTGIFLIEGTINKFLLHQGANDGYRVIMLHCYQGPDRGKGFVIASNAESKALQVNARLAQFLLKSLAVRGVNTALFEDHKNFSNPSLKENEVNMGYKFMVFDAIEPAQAEPIVNKGPLAKYHEVNAFAGAAPLSISNDRFARAENLASPHEPVFEPALFGAQGKIMDSWETVRHNPEPFDTGIFALKAPSKIRYVSLSTKFHTANHAQALRLFTAYSADPVQAHEVEDKLQWTQLLPATDAPDFKMNGHSYCLVDLGQNTPAEATHIKIEIIPDGGFTRLGLYPDGSLPEEEAQRYVHHEKAVPIKWEEEVPVPQKPLGNGLYVPSAEAIEAARKLALHQTPKTELHDVACLGLGAKLLFASDEHYSPASQAISPLPPVNMFDGLESARSRNPATSFEELQVQLAWATAIAKIEIDFTYFVNNSPREMEVEAFSEAAQKWVVVVPKRFIKHYYGGWLREAPVEEFRSEPMEKVRVKLFPCGGLNRLHVYGTAQ